MDSDPAATRDALERAAAALDRLDSFYLPLLDLRERTEVALQALEGGSVEGCQAELGEMTEIVRGLVEGSTPPADGSRSAGRGARGSPAPPGR